MYGLYVIATTRCIYISQKTGIDEYFFTFLYLLENIIRIARGYIWNLKLFYVHKKE